ncbi:UNVERIFIED_CONTAM: protein NO VEIN [Sesamum latifolium]|uniref:Protein NO VEIN n=1 Tax=Sesamum latifolium TaxID=2727402 RepID=A0AAW2VTJ1_9LAMI
MSSDSVVKNWKSEELFHFLSWISSRGDVEKSKILLDILDRLWDDHFSDKVTGDCVDSTGEFKPFKSSFISNLQDFPWMVSNINNKLHYPKALFHDCVTVNSVLGVSAPYTVPKVKSEKLLANLGLKTQVTLDDALSVLSLWRRCEAPLRASVSQMSNFYAFLWKGMTLSKKKIIEELRAGPFIFVPNTSGYSDGDIVPGALLSPQEVYWHDNIGSVDRVKPINPASIASSRNGKTMLYNLYPNLHEFFVDECGVNEGPPLCSYLEILLQLSTITLPHQAAKRVFDVFLMWDDALKSGLMSCEDVAYLKESLLKKEYTVLPTRQDKWVSLHSSFGLICWCDDDNLGREFRHLDGVDFLCLGESADAENQMLQAKVSIIMQRLGIPALSEVYIFQAREEYCPQGWTCIGELIMLQCIEEKF